MRDADADRLPAGRTALVALFVTALAVAQLTASKVLAVDLPFAVPVTGASVFVPAAAFAYALTYFASDCYAELYGRRAARQLVNVGFLMSLVVLALTWAAVYVPVETAPTSPVSAGTFAAALSAAGPVVAGSLVAYLVSQNWDVLAFHALGEATGGDALWLRNVASTASSQLLDTVLFVGLAFGALRPLFGMDPLPLAVLAGLVVGQYLLKLVVALLDTPFVYAVVGLLADRDASEPSATSAD